MSFKMSHIIRRFEKKFVINDCGSKVEDLIYSHPIFFEQHYPDRVVNNVYYDHLQLNCFYDHMNGCCDRFKVRLRWYGLDQMLNDQIALEIKNKKGTISTKESISTSSSHCKNIQLQLYQFTQLEDVLNLYNIQYKQIIFKYNLLNMQASLFNKYLRSYFVSRCGLVRLTVDRQICFSQISGQLELNYPKIIFEVKYNIEDQLIGDKAYKQFNQVQSAFSKYIIGTQMVHD